MKTVAVLFARSDSHYKALPATDVWDIERDARRWPGGAPVVAHPPCRAWASLRHCAKPRPDEKDLARWAVRQVREFGGVLEHPRASTLWADQSLPAPGAIDEYGGWTLPIYQQWWGHKAQKSTYLYIVGCDRGNIPDMPLVLGRATHTVGLWSGRNRETCRPSIAKREFELTPPELAEWLCELARRCAR